MKNKIKQKYPFVSIITPTFNRRPFIPIIKKCIDNQKYPKDKIEWIIVDDGTDKIEDLVKDIPYVKYYKLEDKISLGKKRNLANSYATGDIIIYMDDDDYYPPERIIHAVDTLKAYPKALCAGSSEMYIYFKDRKEMHQFGPYGPNHATAATFAFRKELLSMTSYEENAELAEEKYFLKNYTIPFVQLNPLKTILVFSHNHNSLDKRSLLNQNNPAIKLSEKTVTDFVKEEDINKFFMEEIDDLLDKYEPGKPQNKPDLLNQMNQNQKNREKMMEDHVKAANEYNNMINKILNKNNNNNNNNNSNLTIILHELSNENKLLKEKIAYLEDKIKNLIREKIEHIKKS